MLDFLIRAYDENYARSVWEAYIDVMLNIYKNRKGNICMDYLDKIHCPTLIVQGDRDPVVKKSHATTLKENIRGSR